MKLNAISATILDESSSPAELRDALNAFVQLCSDIGGIYPDPSFDAWAEDSLLASGVAINPQAAAHCAIDYQRSVVFIRGVYAAIEALKNRFPATPLEILYAGCGPFATLLLPLLAKISPGELRINLLDVHQRSLDSVQLLLARFGLAPHAVHTIKGDACHYVHPVNLHLIIAETMQKSLEQEPQFAVTANLAPQLWPSGIFVPQRIEVEMCLADLEHEKELLAPLPMQSRSVQKAATRYPLATICTLSPDCAAEDMHTARTNDHTPNLELAPTIVMIPAVPNIARLDAVLFTKIVVFENFCLEDYESEITLPLKCHELAPLVPGAHYRVSYLLGNYPRFTFKRLIDG